MSEFLLSDNAWIAPPQPAALAVYFDGDGTLWDFQSLMIDGMYAARDVLAQRTGVVTTVEQMIEDRDNVAWVLERDTTTYRHIRKEGFAATSHRLGVYSRPLVAEMTDAFFAARDARPGLFDDTREVLETLQGAARVGYLSNGNSRPEMRGLAGVFDACVMAEDLGVAKPDPAIFRIAEEKLAATRYVLIGDDVEVDIRGANEAGWESVLLDRTGTWVQPSGGDAPRPTWVVRCLSEIPALFA